MKKFKKSLVILPALATMALTTVASVTGTVAWFTANNQASVTSSVFKTGTNEGNLIVSVTSPCAAVEASSTNDSASQTITVKSGVTLLDASYSGTELTDDKPFWTDVAAGEHKYQQVKQHYADGSNYWYGLSWTLTFSVDVENSGNTYDIFFDVADSSTSSVAGETQTGFRTYMKSASVSAVVWAPLSSTEQVNGTYSSSKTDGTKLGYVSGVDETTQYTVATKTAHGLISKEVTDLNDKANDGVSANTTRGDFLGTTSTATGAKNSTLDVNVVVWFDGLDANMINSKLIDNNAITSTMKFYSRLHA